MKLFNNYSGKIETFKSLEKGKVKIYVCGITPYDTTHLGHAFVYVAYDSLIRYLIHKNYDVNYTQNVTDIDDDVLKKAKEKDQDWKELGNFWTERFLEDLKFLNVMLPTHFVKATDSIPKIIEMNKILIEKGVAYEKEGNVYFEISKFSRYGKLSKYSRNKMIDLSRERGANPEDSLKKDPLDFLMWQKSKKDEPYWQSPWGNGRPGWHIECSAMINTYLGSQIDIHGGGNDLIYPHHESEIAQSESYTGKKPFSGFWAETGSVYYENEKMSKSLGNLVMISNLSKKYSANVIRYMLLNHHYRKDFEYFEKDMSDAKEKFEIIEKSLKRDLEDLKKFNLTPKLEKFMDLDLDIPSVLNLIYKTSENILKGKIKSNDAQKQVKEFLTILGFKI